MHITRSRATARHSSSGSKLRFCAASRNAASIWNGRLLASPAVCISGEDGITTGAIPFARSAFTVATSSGISSGGFCRPRTFCAKIAVSPVAQRHDFADHAFGMRWLPPVYIRW